MPPALRLRSPLSLAPTGGTGRSGVLQRANPRRASVLPQGRAEPRQLTLFGPSPTWAAPKIL